MSSPLPSPEVERVARDALARALARVRRETDKEDMDVFAAGRLHSDLSCIERLIEDVLQDSEASLPGTQLHRVTLERLSTALLQEWPGDQPAEMLLRLLRTIEAARAVSAAEPSGADDGGGLDPFARKVLHEVAHTIRSPLGSVVMLANLMADGRRGDLDESQRRQVRIMGRAALTLASLAGDLLAVTDEATELGNVQPFSPARLLESVSDVVRPLTEERGVSLGVLVAGAAAGDRLGRADAVRRVLVNVALDAALRTREGELRLTACTAEGNGLLLEVDGPSGPDSTTGLYRAFQANEEGDQLALAPRGLGMAVARGLARRLGSTLEVTEEGGRRIVSLLLDAPVAP